MAGDTHVIVCSYGGDDPTLVLRTLEAAAAQGPVLLVDMSLETGLAELAAAIGNVSVRHVPESTGLGESRQIGLMATDARYVAFLDSDAVPRGGWLGALREAVDPADVGVAGGPVLPVWPEGRVPALFRTQTGGDFLSMLDLGPKPLDVPRVLPGNMVVDRHLTGERVFTIERGRRAATLAGAEEIARSEERRVGKECRSRWSPYH